MRCSRPRSSYTINRQLSLGVRLRQKITAAAGHHRHPDCALHHCRSFVQHQARLRTLRTRAGAVLCNSHACSFVHPFRSLQMPMYRRLIGLVSGSSVVRKPSSFRILAVDSVGRYRPPRVGFEFHLTAGSRWSTSSLLESSVNHCQGIFGKSQKDNS